MYYFTKYFLQSHPDLKFALFTFPFIYQTLPRKHTLFKTGVVEVRSFAKGPDGDITLPTAGIWVNDHVIIGTASCPAEPHSTPNLYQ